MRRGSRFVVVVAAAALLTGACGGKDDTGGTKGPATTTAPRPEDVIAPLTEVKLKLPALITLGNQAAAQAQAGDWETAGDTYDSLINVWFEVEGAVGDQDRDIYERAETAQGLISDGVDVKNVDRVATGAADQAAALQQFLDTYAK